MNFEMLPAGGDATNLWVMLPGAYMKPADFVAAGFVRALGDRRLPHDVALLDASIDEVANGAALARLQQFVVEESARQPGRRVQLLGISLGAQLALKAVSLGGISGAVLLAPYLGPRDIAAEVAAAGGLAHWQADAPGTPAATDADRQLWRWLQQRPAAAAPLYLGYGSEDRFARAHALVAQTLPAARVDAQPGGHDWPVWTLLWNRYLDRHHADAA